MTEWVKKLSEAKKAIEPILQDTPQAHQSGIYLFERTDENGIKWFYCGQAKDIYKRTISHYNGWTHIDQSLRKRGFYNRITNPHGWTFKILECCPEEQLDEREQYHIVSNLKQGKQTYNVTFGSQGQGKRTFDTKKPPKTYRDGVAYGERRAIEKIAHLFDLHLKAVTRADKPSKTALKALENFTAILRGESEE